MSRLFYLGLIAATLGACALLPTTSDANELTMRVLLTGPQGNDKTAMQALLTGPRGNDKTAMQALLTGPRCNDNPTK